jgi:hypothetical protein
MFVHIRQDYGFIFWYIQTYEILRIVSNADKYPY